MRRLVRDISSVLILAGLFVLLDGAITLLWQEPVTAAIGRLRSDGVDKRYLSYRQAPLTPVQHKALDAIALTRQRVRYLARAEQGRLRTGDGIGTIDIPAIHKKYAIVQGTDEESLQKGPGHYPGTALPGMGRTVGVAGHRTTYLAPFRSINELHRGDRIVVTMRYGRFTYLVQGQRIVKPTDVWVVDDHGYDRLVLSACNPLYSAKQRIIVFARLHAVTPLGPARRTAGHAA